VRSIIKIKPSRWRLLPFTIGRRNDGDPPELVVIKLFVNGDARPVPTRIMLMVEEGIRQLDANNPMLRPMVEKKRQVERIRMELQCEPALVDWKPSNLTKRRHP
jgi:hypothetical protein